MTSRVEHTDVGAYALGLLDDDDKAAFEEHLATCPPCAAELADLSGVAGALVGIGPLEDLGPPPSRGEAEVVDLMRRKRAADRRARRGTIVIGMAAAVTLVAGGLTIGTQLGDSGRRRSRRPGSTTTWARPSSSTPTAHPWPAPAPPA